MKRKIIECDICNLREQNGRKNGGISMKHKYPLSHADVENLKIENKKTQWRIESDLSTMIETLENVIDIKDERIDELNKKIEELEKTKKAVDNQIFDIKEVGFKRTADYRIVIWANCYICNELRKAFSQCTLCNQGIIHINGNEYYLAKTEAIEGRVKAKLISYSSYDFNEAQKISKELLNNEVYDGTVTVEKGDNDNEHNVG